MMTRGREPGLIGLGGAPTDGPAGARPASPELLAWARAQTPGSLGWEALALSQLIRDGLIVAPFLCAESVWTDADARACQHPERPPSLRTEWAMTCGPCRRHLAATCRNNPHHVARLWLDCLDGSGRRATLLDVALEVGEHYGDEVLAREASRALEQLGALR